MATVRVTAGSLRGRRVPVPPKDVRPTSERARQAYFNIVAEEIVGAQFLDLFAGSGIFSFEALSRGAAGATAIELSRRNCEEITRLAATFGVAIDVHAGDVFTAMRRLRDTVFDLVYADPPYDFARYGELLEAIDREPKLRNGALVAIEHRRNTGPFDATLRRLVFERQAEYGEVWISFWRNEPRPRTENAH